MVKQPKIPIEADRLRHKNPVQVLEIEHGHPPLDPTNEIWHHLSLPKARRQIKMQLKIHQLETGGVQGRRGLPEQAYRGADLSECLHQ